MCHFASKESDHWFGTDAIVNCFLKLCIDFNCQLSIVNYFCYICVQLTKK